MKIIENIIPASLQDDLEKKILDPRFPWGYMFSSDLASEATSDYVIRKRKQFDNLHIIDPPQFYHNILINQQPGQFFQWFTPILDAIQFDNMRILRMKMNFNFPYLGADDLSIGVPHVDLPEEENYQTAIYYVTDADGDTILFNEKNGHQGLLTIQKRISPKRGSLLMFDGNTLHAACPPKSNQRRIVVNINFK